LRNIRELVRDEKGEVMVRLGRCGNRMTKRKLNNTEYIRSVVFELQRRELSSVVIAMLQGYLGEFEAREK
jgi:hypothetical protein